MKKQELDVNLINSNIIADENYSFSDILKSVNLFGQLQPIIVKKDKRKTYTLIDGSKRLISLKLCGYTTVKAIILNSNEQKELKNSDFCLKELYPLDEAKFIYDSIKNLGISKTLKLLGVSKSYCVRRCELLKLINEFKELLSNGKMKFLDALDLCRLPEVVQKTIFEKWNHAHLDVNMTCRRFSENLLDAKFYAKECHNCVYNTSSNQLLFGDYRKFTCVNPDCYKKKQIKFSQTKVRNSSPYYLFLNLYKLFISVEGKILLFKIQKLSSK